MTNTHTGKVFDRLAVQIVSKVADRVDNSGELGAYEGIEAAREIRELMIEAHAALVRRIDALEKALNPSAWTKEMSAAWHLNIPDTQRAFYALYRAALHPSDNEVKK